MAALKPIEIKPAQGGQLLADLSAENIGIFNYGVKREWRRVLDREMRSEGHDLFCPNTLLASNPPLPDTKEKITLIAESLSPSGRRAVVVGTKSKLWRYHGLEDGACYEPDVFEAGIYDDNPGDWILIGSGFSLEGQRWEAEAVSEWLILNNGVDLPVSYRVQDMAVEPLYELREQGVASVGTIGKWNNVLVCGDIRQLTASKHEEIMSAVESVVEAGNLGRDTSEGVLGVVNNGTPGVPGNTLTAESADFNGGLGFTGLDGGDDDYILMMNGLERRIAAVISPTQCTLEGEPDLAEPAQPFFLPPDGDGEDRLLRASFTGVDPVDWSDMFPGLTADDLVGRRLFWASGEVRTIVAANPGGGNLLVDNDGPIPIGPVSLENPLAYVAFTDNAHLERFQSRTLPAMPGEPRRFAAIIPATATASSHVLTLKYPVKSLESGQEVTITDAGENGETLRTTILWIYPGLARVVVMVDKALTGVLETQQAAIAAESAAQTRVNDLTASLTAARLALTAAQDASEAAPEDEDLLAAVATASEKVPELAALLAEAQTALTAATTAREAADELETSTDEALLTRSDAIGSIVAYDDLDGDGSGIVRIMELRGYLVVYKETGLFVGRYQGLAGAAFKYEELKVPLETALRHKHTLVNVGGQYHLYAGQADFYSFDLVTRVPQLFAPLKPCSKSLFFDVVPQELLGPELVGVADDDQHITWSDLDPGKQYQLNSGLTGGEVQIIIPTEDDEVNEGQKVYTANADPAIATLREVLDNPVFAAENSVTGEVWFVFAASVDNVLRYDTESGTVSTSTLPIASAATVLQPQSKVQVGRVNHWFVMGGDASNAPAVTRIFRYGATNEPVKKSGVITATVSVALNKATASAAIFSASDVGKSLLFANRKCVAITRYLDSRNVTVLGAVAGITAQTFTIVPAIWHRDGAAYDSILESGMEAFGKPDSEKSWSQYVPVLASQSSANTPIIVTLRGALNPSEAEDFFTETLERPLTNNLVTLILEQHYLGDRVKVSGRHNPCELTSRNLLVSGVDSRSFNRRET